LAEDRGLPDSWWWALFGEGAQPEGAGPEDGEVNTEEGILWP
jgi:hypothetical protein